MTTVPKPDLATLMDFIGKRLPFTQEEYPGADLSPGGPRRAFAVRHGMMHMTKSIGKIAAQIEAADHGGAMDMLALKGTMASMLVSVLNLSNQLGMSPEELAFEVARTFQKRS